MAVFYTPAIGNRDEAVNNKGLAKNLYLPLNINRNQPRTTNSGTIGDGAGQERPNYSVNMFDWVAQNDVRSLGVAQAPTGGFVTLAADTTIAWNDTYKGKLILLDGTSATADVTLPPAADAEGAIFFFRSIDSTNSTSVDANGSENLNGGTAAVAITAGNTLTVVSDGTEWYSI